MSDRIDVERIVRVHTPEGYIEVGTDPDTGTAVQIRTTDPRSIEYFGRVNLTLYSGGDDKAFAYALADAIRHVADSLGGSHDSRSTRGEVSDG